ncbi:hypothetical protein Q3O59_12350 [Alkalimonas delamerensis]|uniref:Uncharacterized protein n=1 Tax=Alkalimonas delamerensis TaxID=265981 RepID=A0ABT9GS67_9GAMM|nr:hypothetical protein [Alkalimonas delamerensis]MDP4529813.1 hypothetical protein [Alkalimonas delamerensis]
MVAGQQKFQLKREARVIWLTAIGTWSSRTVEDYIRQLRALVATLNGQPWAMVLDGREWQACPADVFETLRENSSWCFEHRLSHGVVLLPEDALLRWQFMQATKVEKPAHYHRNLVDSLEEARALMSQTGFFSETDNQALGS